MERCEIRYFLITWFLHSLQVLITAVHDLLTKLLEADKVPTYTLKDYFDWLTPSESEWEKMRGSLSNEVYKFPQCHCTVNSYCQHLQLTYWDQFFVAKLQTCG